MSVRVVFLSAIIKKSAVKRLYAGGSEQFKIDYPHAGEDKHLFIVACMSGGEFDELIEELISGGLDPDSSFAIGEVNQGEVKACSDIKFEQVSGGMFPRWDARLLRDEPEVMAREGEKLYRLIMERGWIFDIPDETTSDRDRPCQPTDQPKSSAT